ncbi:ankyrin repeat protein [Aspergillus oryzae 100-8]|uniref:Ankyrin repeat protein n=1 Tax=Aspergillus oryzae (strain 3.042) TaxID=1160506 RepID=I7ZZR4_ASPO3|nr:ankyrin repeat protein [Aspergillus oryzae 3.042]KDE75747.1 ankyrin repeat protein [Aspergillus oryzae 100-8]|eukprot:EIT77782.1 ankyrin repeat protein [Aspergillus oryzae 3.042]
MSLLNLPNEVLLLIIETLSSQKDILYFLMTSRRIYHIQQVDPLYKFNIKFGGSSSLRWYSRKGYTLPIEALLKRGVDLECTNERGWTPLIYAASLGHKDVVRLLLEKGADLDNDDHPYGRTPVIWAAMNGHEDVVGLLLEKGARLDLVDNEYHRTPVIWAAKKGNEGVVRLLLERGVDLSHGDGQGYTPLAWAAIEGHEGVVRALISRTKLEAAVHQCYGLPKENTRMWSDYCLKKVLISSTKTFTAVHQWCMLSQQDMRVYLGCYLRTVLSCGVYLNGVTPY